MKYVIKEKTVEAVLEAFEGIVEENSPKYEVDGSGDTIKPVTKVFIVEVVEN